MLTKVSNRGKPVKTALDPSEALTSGLLGAHDLCGAFFAALEFGAGLCVFRFLQSAMSHVTVYVREVVFWVYAGHTYRSRQFLHLFPSFLSLVAASHGDLVSVSVRSAR